ncbi:glycoside hydrolase family 15 protein [Mycena sp. CBHHK59/15]|nr:glycoside hydrolase family 15 protein [Mycena sp. CBHHK59/15]
MDGMLANIGPSGSKAQSVPAGVVVASPSKNNPDYFYTWTRDLSLVFKCVVDKYSSGQYPELQSLIQDFVQAEAVIQKVPNPSGNFASGGLGEPKFNADETAFIGAWGRPQRDGPALRAIAVISCASLLNDSATVLNTLWPIIEPDLDYVQNDWNLTTFDLWEEVSSSSFFTTAVQHRALRQGAALAKSLGQTSVAISYSTQADNLLCFLQSYWNLKGYITANTGGGRSGKDANTVLASIHTFDIFAGCDSVTFQPCSDKALANLKVYVDSFRSIYRINNNASSGAVATGRYAEDSYMGGNPWYLTTFAVAQQLYAVWNAQGYLTVSDISLAFFRQFMPSVTAGTYPSSSSTLTSAITSHADGYVAIVDKYTPLNGGLSEQHSRDTGVPLSAVDLTWSYAFGLTALDAKAGKTPESWGASGLTVPAVCAPDNGGGSGGGGGGGAPSVSVKFIETVTVDPGESIYLVGSVPQLMQWNANNAIPLISTNSNTWKVSVSLPTNTHVEYKYIRKANNAPWESDPNMQLTTPADGTVTEHDTWR